MKYLYLLLIIIIFSTLLSCKKEGLPDPPPCNNCFTDTIIVWKNDIDPLSGIQFLFANPAVYNGDPIFGVYRFGDCEYGAADRINCYDAETGVKKWEINPIDQCSHIENLYVISDILIVHLQREIIAYNLLDRTLLWSTLIPSHLSGSFGLNVVNNKIYLGVQSKGDPLWPEKSALLQVDILTGNYTEICEFDKATWGGYPSVHPPSLWVDPSTGDSLLMVAVGLYDHGKGPMAARHSLHAYDLKTNSYRWQVDSIGIPTNNNKRVEVYDNKVYVLTDWRIHCFDAAKGTKLWEQEMPGNTKKIDFADSRPLGVNGKLVVNSTSDRMTCFDANTGQVLWNLTQLTATANNDLIEHNGVIYLSSGGNGRFVGVDLETGKILLNLRSPNKSTHFAGYNVVLNKVKNLLFLNDFKSAFAYRPVR